MNLLTKLRRRLALAVTITGRVDDSPGWHSMTHRPHDREWGEIQELYLDALTAWRKNPMAKRIVDLTTDYVLGDGLTITSPFKPLADFTLADFITAFWPHD